jgi:hypothetical protein
VSVGRLGKAFQHRYPKKTFKEFWEFCCQYQSLHSYPLRYFMTMHVTSKIALVNPRACEAPLVKEELHTEEDVMFRIWYDQESRRTILRWLLHRTTFLMKAMYLILRFSPLSIWSFWKKTSSPFGSEENEGWKILTCTDRIRVSSKLFDCLYWMNLFMRTLCEFVYFPIAYFCHEKASLWCDA